MLFTHIYPLTHSPGHHSHQSLSHQRCHPTAGSGKAALRRSVPSSSARRRPAPPGATHNDAIHNTLTCRIFQQVFPILSFSFDSVSKPQLPLLDRQVKTDANDFRSLPSFKFNHASLFSFGLYSIVLVFGRRRSKPPLRNQHSTLLTRLANLTLRIIACSYWACYLKSLFPVEESITFSLKFFLRLSPSLSPFFFARSRVCPPRVRLWNRCPHVPFCVSLLLYPCPSLVPSHFSLFSTTSSYSRPKFSYQSPLRGRQVTETGSFDHDHHAHKFTAGLGHGFVSMAYIWCLETVSYL